MTDHTNDRPTPPTEALTDEQLETVTGASATSSRTEPDADLLKPYPPWPG